jgi:hypothetical protein
VAFLATCNVERMACPALHPIFVLMAWNQYGCYSTVMDMSDVLSEKSSCIAGHRLKSNMYTRSLSYHCC